MMTSVLTLAVRKNRGQLSGLHVDLPPIPLHDLRHGAPSSGNGLEAIRISTPASCSPLTLTPACWPTSPTTPRNRCQATARLILTAAATTSRTIRNGHRTRYQRPAKPPPHTRIPPQQSTQPSPPLRIRPQIPVQKHDKRWADQPGSTSRDVNLGNWCDGPTQDHPN
jgi:hypothetical protein